MRGCGASGRQTGRQRAVDDHVLRRPPLRHGCSCCRTGEALVRLAFDKHPSLQVRNLLTVDFRLKSQAKLRRFPKKQAPIRRICLIAPRARWYRRDVLEKILMPDRADLQDAQPWRDVYVDGRVFARWGCAPGTSRFHSASIN
jgi:hypothetical protein